MIVEKSIPVISNCQAQPIAQALSQYCPGHDFSNFGVHLLGDPPSEDKITDFISQFTTSPVIISIRLSEQYGPLSANNIEGTFKDSVVIFIQNLYFSGLHPDLTYIGGRGGRVLGPLGDYHSKLTAASFLFGLSPGDTASLFKYEVYGALNFFDELSVSFKEMRERANTIDVDITSALEDYACTHDLFLSVNHPTSFVFSLLAEKIARRMQDIGLCSCVRKRIPGALLPNFLATNNIFPVYPEVAEFHSARIWASYDFVGVLPGQKQRILSLEDFIAEEYKCYQSIDRGRLMGTQSIKNVFSKLSEII